MITFRRQNRFTVDDPKELQRQLTELESAIEEAFRDVERKTIPRGKRVEVAGGQTVDALVGNLYVCDSSGGNITLKLEKPKVEHELAYIWVWKTSSSNSVILAPIDSNVDDASTLSLSTKAFYDVSSDGRNYRKEF